MLLEDDLEDLMRGFLTGLEEEVGDSSLTLSLFFLLDFFFFFFTWLECFDDEEEDGFFRL